MNSGFLDERYFIEIRYTYVFYGCYFSALAQYYILIAYDTCNEITGKRKVKKEIKDLVVWIPAIFNQKQTLESYYATLSNFNNALPKLVLTEVRTLRTVVTSTSPKIFLRSLGKATGQQLRRPHQFIFASRLQVLVCGLLLVRWLIYTDLQILFSDILLYYKPTQATTATRKLLF